MDLKRFLALALMVTVAGATFSVANSSADELEELSLEDRQAKFQEMQEKRESMKLLMEDVEKSVVLIDNGAVITLTTDNAEALEHLQTEREKPERPEREGSEDRPEINHEKVNLDNGVQITVTSDNAEAVEKIQERAQSDKIGRRGHRGPRK